MDPWYIAVLVTALLAWGAQALVQNSYRKYETVRNRRNANGLLVAKALLAHKGLSDVKIEKTKGTLTDHFNPDTRTLHLSEAVLSGSSVTAMGIAAHEVGHAVQHEENYRFSRLRLRLAGPVGTLSRLSPMVFVGGMMMAITPLMAVGGVMLAGQAVFSLVTLPVERDASRRAVAMLEETGWAEPEESQGVKGVLRSAALTYAANLARRVASFLFFAGILLAAGGSR